MAMYRCGSTSSEGTAVSNQVLSGMTFSNDNDIGILGTMPNNGNWTQTVAAGSSIVIPEGYHAGGGVIQSDLTPQSINLKEINWSEEWANDKDVWVATGLDLNYASVFVNVETSSGGDARLRVYFYKNGNVVYHLDSHGQKGKVAGYFKNVPFDSIFVATRSGYGARRRYLNVLAFKLN